MDHARLFKVLVIGGAMLGIGCQQEAPPPATDAGREVADAAMGEDAAIGQDAAMGIDAAMGTDAAMGIDAGGTDDGGELELCGICPNTECCVTDEMGTSSTREGMICCWGTSC